MTQPRHRRPRHRQTRAPSSGPRAALVVVPVLIVATAAVGAARSSDSPLADQIAAPEPAAELSASLRDEREVAADSVSRSLVGGRTTRLKGLVSDGKAIEEAPIAPRRHLDAAALVTDRRFLTADLNVWTGPGETFRLQTVLATGGRVAVTGLVDGDWAQIVYHDKIRWVRATYLTKLKPDESVAAAGDVTEAPCPLGSTVEAGLVPNAIRVYRSVCAAFPEVTSYGGVRADGGEHGEGRALDIMVPDSSLGDAIADWVRANASAVGASEVLWAQHIWTVERSSEGWRLFEDRGSATANHYDHVHVTVY